MAATANDLVADRLTEMAALLEHQGADPFRIRAYRRAAAAIAALPEDVADLVRQGGAERLTAIPGIGEGIAASITEMVRRGRWSQLERLRGTLSPEDVFTGIPGIGPALARRLHEGLHVDTLAALEAAAHDGRLAALPGLGPRRAAMIRASLAQMLARPRPPRTAAAPAEEPPVAELLAVDADYRTEAEAGRLPCIAPKRFNPSGEAWLPVMHRTRGPWHYTALFSNTAQAHKLNRTRDWVVIYFERDALAEGQRTVVTETRGPLVGRRVVRGREAECRALAAVEDAGENVPP